MEPITVETSIESSRSFTAAGLVLIAGGVVVLLILVGAVTMLRRKDDRFLQLVGRILLFGTVALIFTSVMGVFEVFDATVVPYLFAAEVVLTLTAAWAIVLADAAMNEPQFGNDKVVWVVIIVFTGPLGAILYMTLRRPQRKIELAE